MHCLPAFWPELLCEFSRRWEIGIMSNGDSSNRDEQRRADNERQEKAESILSETTVRLSELITGIGHGIRAQNTGRFTQYIHVLTQAFEQSPVSIVITDSQGAIQYVNPKFTQLSGYTRAEVAGKNPRVLKSGYTSSEEYRRLWECICSGRTWNGEFHNRHKDGHCYWVEATIGPIKDETGKITHFVGAQVEISRRKRAEEALRQSAALLKRILRSVHEVVFTMNKDGEVLEIFGLLPFGESITPQTLADLFRKNQMALHYGAFSKALNGDSLQYEWSFSENGRVQTFQVYLSPLADTQSESRTVLGTLKNITEQAQLRQLDRFRFLVERTISRISSRFTRFRDYHKAVYLSLQDLGRLLEAEAIYFAGYNGSHILIHPEHLWLRVKRPEYLRYPVFIPANSMKPLLDASNSEQHLQFFRDIDALPEELRNAIRAFVFTSPNSLLVVPVRLEEEKFGLIIVESPKNQYLNDPRQSNFLHFTGKIFAHGIQRFTALRDIQSQSDQLHRRVTELIQIIESLQIAVLLLDQENGRVLETNKMARSLLGYSRGELEEIYFVDLIRKRDGKLCSADSLLEPVRNRECVLQSQDGQSLPVLLNMIPSHWNERDVVVVSLVDLSDQKRTEEEIRALHKKNEQLLNSISSILIGVDAEDNISHFNRVAEQVFGVKGEAIIGQPVLGCPIPWNWMKIIETISSCREENRAITINDFKYRRPDGKDGFLNLTINPYVDENPILSGFLIMGEDVTERKLLESQLSQAQKMESIGQLAAGIAHEINTPTQYIGDNTYFLKEAFEDINKFLKSFLEASQGEECSLQSLREMARELDLDYLCEEIPPAIQQTLDGVAQVSKIVRAIKEFSHPGVEEKMPVDLNKSLENTVIVARNEWKYVAEVETDFDPELPLVYCLPGELNQVFLNVIVNAAHAIADVVGEGGAQKGKIHISTRRDGDWVEVRISDSGIGIPREIQNRIFDPFFTTKEVGKGTGQGLSIAHAVVTKKHGGTIHFESESGKGTTFVIRLPIHMENGDA